MDLARAAGEVPVHAGMFTRYLRGEEHQEWNGGREPVTLLAVLWSRGGESEPVSSPSSASSSASGALSSASGPPSSAEGAFAPSCGEDRLGRMRCAAEWLADLHAEGIPGDSSLVEGILWGLYYESRRRPDCRRDPRIEEALSYLRRHFREPVDLRSLASRVGLSPFHFSRMFAAQTGEPPMRHLRRLRVEEADRLARSSSLPLGAIAERLGFRDDEGLRRAFRAVTGRLPSGARAAGAGRRAGRLRLEGGPEPGGPGADMRGGAAEAEG